MISPLWFERGVCILGHPVRGVKLQLQWCVDSFSLSLGFVLHRQG
ncbi:hypothetical protein ebA4400 [Aromatoleum aromaticum EbN1]|uniref:Uncharacterized protein n=1 Tax=Aromatoleum aromaticum (strain DSM 19018 / LMG 30748 / EbN1) TaxID=76114 RepID=Q5P242_AROAE|nr:hypothetical protein ebA4400 [Aromatoleum aromaticum EbN1]